MDSPLARGRRTWTSVCDDDIELDLYLNYAGKINDTFAWTTGATWYDYPAGDDLDGYCGSLRRLQRRHLQLQAVVFADDFYALGDKRHVHRSELHRTDRPTAFSLAFHARLLVGRLLGRRYEEQFDYAVQANCHVPATSRSSASSRAPMPASVTKSTDDVGNNEAALPRWRHDDVPLGRLNQRLKRSTREQDQRSTLT